MASSKKILRQMVDKQKGYTHVKFYCKTKSRSKVTEEVAESEPPPPPSRPYFSGAPESLIAIGLTISVFIFDRIL